MNTVKFDKKETKIIAHRGLSGIEKENTNAAFVAAGNRSYFGIETDIHVTKDGRIVVIHDDMDLKIGQLKAKKGGGSGGHNGLKSIDAHITPNYNRIRIGVGHPLEKGREVINYVLGAFSKEEKNILEDNFKIVEEAVEVLIRNDVAACSNFLGMSVKK